MTPAEAISQLQGIAKGSKKAMKKAELRIAEKIANEARSNAPKDSGELVNSIGVEQDDELTTVFVGVSYAPYVEFGTGSLVSIPNGLEEEARQFFINGKGHTSAQPFFFPAVFAIIDKLDEYLDEELSKLAE